MKEKDADIRYKRGIFYLYVIFSIILFLGSTLLLFLFYAQNLGVLFDLEILLYILFISITLIITALLGLVITYFFIGLRHVLKK